MKTNTTGFPVGETQLPDRISAKIDNRIQSLKKWVQTQEPVWEYNRLGIAASGIFIQVTFAGAMILILGAAGASPFIYSIGIFLAFMADSLAFAQARMRWVLATFVVSIVVNFILTVVYLFVLL